MIILEGTDSLTAVMTGAVTTTAPTFSSAFAEISSSDLTTLADATFQKGVFNGTTPISLVTAPGGTNERDVKYIHVHNGDSVSVEITVTHEDRIIFVFTMVTGGSATYSSEFGWSVYDASGNKTAATVAHAANHENGGSDEISVAGLSGLLADGQTPLNHATDHQNAGGDEINVAGLSGELADDQPPLQATDILKGGSELATQAEVDAGVDTSRIVTPETLAATTLEMNPEAHSADHENGGGDEISVLGLSGLLADDQNPTAHASDHENAGGDEISVLGLSGLLADDQNPTAHAADHVRAGSDEIDGDVLDIDFTPTNYTPSVTPGEVTNVDELTAHLAGIDDELGAAGGGGDVVQAATPITTTAIGTSLVTVLTINLTGLVAGDTVEIDIFGAFLQNSGVGINMTHTLSVGGNTVSGTDSLGNNTTVRPTCAKIMITIQTDAIAVISFEADYGLGNDARVAGRSQLALDITGSQTVLWRVQSSSSGSPQTYFVDSWVARVIPTTP